MNIKPQRLKFSRERIQPKQLSLDEFYNKRNKILIMRKTGGLGDILMHRMIFSGFKRIMPECEIHFACPPGYFGAIEDHPYIDKLLDWRQISENNYVISYETSTVCGRYEISVSPFSGLHRSDIWANHCGVMLTDHDMHFRLSPELIDFGFKEVEKIRKETYGGLNNYPSVCFCPISASKAKNLTEHLCQGTTDLLLKHNLMPFILHNNSLDWDNHCPVLRGYSIKQWMAIINASDYVVSVDTAAFHCAGGLNKPVLGIFTHVDGKVYGKYYNKFVLVQKHRDNGDWECGPCYNTAKCPKVPDFQQLVKPCLSELTLDMIENGIQRLLEKYK